LKTDDTLKNNRQNVKPSPSLVEFKEKYCPHLSFDDPALFYLLLERLKEKNEIENERESNGNEKQKP
jgi:hypothetical protein